MGGGAEIVLQAAAMQARRGIVGGKERNLVALADLADGDSDRALVGADNGGNLLLGDQALGFGATLLRIGLVIGKHQLDLGAAEPRQPLPPGQRQLKIIILVDDVGGRLESPLRIDPDLGAGAGQRIDHANRHFRGFCARCNRTESCGCGGSKQNVSAADLHHSSSVWR